MSTDFYIPLGGQVGEAIADLKERPLVCCMKSTLLSSPQKVRASLQEIGTSMLLTFDGENALIALEAVCRENHGSHLILRGYSDLVRNNALRDLVGGLIEDCDLSLHTASGRMSSNLHSRMLEIMAGEEFSSIVRNWQPDQKNNGRYGTRLGPGFGNELDAGDASASRELPILDGNR